MTPERETIVLAEITEGMNAAWLRVQRQEAFEPFLDDARLEELQTLCNNLFLQGVLFQANWTVEHNKKT